MYDFETIVIDPRGYFAENIEFKELPSQLHQAYPSEVLDSIPLDPYTYCAILSHDPKIDDNALEIILHKDMVSWMARYVNNRNCARIPCKDMKQKGCKDYVNNTNCIRTSLYGPEFEQ